jgi:hypothetical protein
MPAFKVVYPHGNVVVVTGEVPDVGSSVDEFRVDFVDRQDPEQPTVYLGLHYGQTEVVKLVFIDTGEARFPLTLAEAAELSARLRRRAAMSLAHPGLAVAVQVERLVEEGVEVVGSEFTGNELDALLVALDEWFLEKGSELPGRVRALRAGLRERAT